MHQLGNIGLLGILANYVRVCISYCCNGKLAGSYLVVMVWRPAFLEDLAMAFISDEFDSGFHGRCALVVVVGKRISGNAPPPLITHEQEKGVLAELVYPRNGI